MQEDEDATDEQVLTSYSCRTFFQTLTDFLQSKEVKQLHFYLCYFICVHLTTRYLLPTVELSPRDESVVFESPFSLQTSRTNGGASEWGSFLLGS